MYMVDVACSSSLNSEWGCRSSVVRASTAKVGGLGFNSQWLPKFFPSVCFYSDLPPVAYQQFLLPVVVIRIVTKIVMHVG